SRSSDSPGRRRSPAPSSSSRLPSASATERWGMPVVVTALDQPTEDQRAHRRRGSRIHERDARDVHPGVMPTSTVSKWVSPSADGKTRGYSMRPPEQKGTATAIEDVAAQAAHDSPRRDPPPPARPTARGSSSSAR